MKNKFADSAKKIVPQIFDEMLQLDPQIYENGADKDSYEVSAMIGFGGKANGFISINMTVPVALKLASCMLGADMEEMNDDIKDAAGEMANMVAGTMKNDLANQDVHFEISVPTVIVGKGIEVRKTKCKEIGTLTYQIPEGQFDVEFGLSST